MITTDANSVVESLHDRMPVILPERYYSRWLDVDSSQLPMDLLRPCEADQMTAWEVDNELEMFAMILPNSSKNNRRSLKNRVCSMALLYRG